MVRCGAFGTAKVLLTLICVLACTAVIFNAVLVENPEQKSEAETGEHLDGKLFITPKAPHIRRKESESPTTKKQTSSSKKKKQKIAHEKKNVRAPALSTNSTTSSSVRWKKYPSRSCQGYANGDHKSRDLVSSKKACLLNDLCVAIECERSSGPNPHDCTLRSTANLVRYIHADCYTIPEEAIASGGGPKKMELHKEYRNLIQYYPFQQVMTQRGRMVNIILVRSPLRSQHQYELYKKYKDSILFLGISSFEDYPKPSVNPYSSKYPADKYVGMFPGFLHMMHPDEAKRQFPSHVKTLLMSQSDFNLPKHSYRDYSVPRKYDFTFSGTDQDIYNGCKGWSSFAKNWSFVEKALEVMCGEFKMTGVLVATIDKQNDLRCKIPDSCKGLITQTQYIPQPQLYHYMEQSKFLFLPQIHDASPRVSSQALALDTPLLMNAFISGGWKYLNNKTGEVFHDMYDFRSALKKILRNADIKKHYEPRKWVTSNYGNQNAGRRLLKFVKEEFPEWYKYIIPKGTTKLFI